MRGLSMWTLCWARPSGGAPAAADPVQLTTPVLPTSWA